MDVEYKVAGNDNFSHFADFFQPFLIDECHVRGNFIRLGKAVDTILHRHQYPQAISRLLAEQLVLACMLSGNLEGRGSITMQVRGGDDGPVKFTVVDVNGEGDMRGYAELSDDAEAQLKKLEKKKKTPVLQDFVGKKGYLAITMNSGPNSQQYQGIVGLEGDTLAEALSQYFGQSEQIGVSIKVAVGAEEKLKRTVWSASGMMVQRVPSEGGKKRSKKQAETEEENWNRATILMQTVQDDELLNERLPAQTLLKRLFNEDGVWVYEPRQLDENCRCSRERVWDVLATFPPEDIEDMKMDGTITVNCQFCNSTEVFDEKDVAELIQKAKKR